MLHRLLVAALRCRLTGDRPPDLPDGVAAVAAKHRVRGTLYHIGPRLGEHDAAAIEHAWHLNVTGHLARIAALKEMWPAGAPPPMVIKGADLAEHLYRDPGARAANDLDLLLPDPHYGPLAAGLGGVRRPAPRYERFTAEAPIAVGIEWQGVLIELHCRLTPAHRDRVDPADLYRRGVAVTLDGFAARAPSAEDRLWIWLANAAKDALHVDLGGLLDLALVLDDLGALERPRWEEWRGGASARGLRRPFDLALHRLDLSGLWPAALPAPGRRTRWVARHLPPIEAGRVEPDPLVFQALKLWLCDARRRPAMVARGAATLWRRR